MSKGSLRSKPSFRDRMMSGSSRPGTMTGGGKGPKEFYCTVFGQMDKSQTNLAVVLRTYFYPKEEFTGQLKHVEERWDDNPSFKIICNHEINSDPPSVMLCNPVRVKSKPGCQFRIDLLNQEAFLDTAEFYADGPQLPKCLQFDISLSSYNIDTMASPAALAAGTSDQIPCIKIIRSPDESEVGQIPLIHLCDIPDAAMTGSFSFDDFCYTLDPKPRFGTKIEHNRSWHRLPQLLVKFMSEDRELASKVMEIAKEWERHTPGVQIIQCPKDASRDAQIRIKFSSRNQCAIGTDAEDVPNDKATMHLNVARDTHPVIFRRRVLHQFGHALGLYHEFEAVPESVEWDEANIQLDTSMEAGWSTAETKRSLICKESCTNGDDFDRLSIMTQTYKRSYIKGWLPRQHQSILSVDDKALVNALYPPPGDTHKWSDPLASPEPVELEESEDESEEEEDDTTEWKKAAMRDEAGTPVDMFSGVFADQGSAAGDPNDSQRARMRSSGGEFEPTSSGKKVAMKSASALFEFEPTEDGKKVIQPGTGKSFIEYVEPKYTKEELDDTREGDFFSFRDMKNLRELELPLDDRNSTPLFSPPDTPDSMPDSLAPTPTSKLFLSDAFMDIREEWLNVQQEQMIQITQESMPGTRGQKVKLQPGDILYRDADENRDVRGEKLQEDTFGRKHQEASLFGERTNVVSPDGIIEREHFYKALNKLADGEKEADLTFNQQYQGAVKEKNKQEEFFQPTREYVGDQDIQGMGFDENKRALRSERHIEYEPAEGGKKVMMKGKGKGKGGKGKGKKGKDMFSPVNEEEEESFYAKAHKMGQSEKQKVEEEMSFRGRMDNRGTNKPFNSGLNELKPVDEDIFELLDRAQREGRGGGMGQGKFVSQNNAPALISTKGSFQGIGGSGGYKESGWQSFYDYAEEDMINYEYQEQEEDNSMDLVSFRNRLAKRSGITHHEGIGLSPANSNARQYLESPVPVANRSQDSEDKINLRSVRRQDKQGRYYDDEVDLVSPNKLMDEALDRGFGRKGKGGDDSDDEISREKKAASKKYYGIGQHQSGGEGGDYDDVAETKRRNKQSEQRSQKSASNKSDGKHSEQQHEERYNSRAESQRLSSIYNKNVEGHVEGYLSSQGGGGQESVEPDMNWNMDSTHVKKEKTFSESARYSGKHEKHAGGYENEKHEKIRHSSEGFESSGQPAYESVNKSAAFSDSARYSGKHEQHSEKQDQHSAGGLAQDEKHVKNRHSTENVSGQAGYKSSNAESGQSGYKHEKNRHSSEGLLSSGQAGFTSGSKSAAFSESARYGGKHEQHSAKQDQRSAENDQHNNRQSSEDISGRAGYKSNNAESGQSGYKHEKNRHSSGLKSGSKSAAFSDAAGVYSHEEHEKNAASRQTGYKSASISAAFGGDAAGGYSQDVINAASGQTGYKSASKSAAFGGDAAGGHSQQGAESRTNGGSRKSAQSSKKEAQEEDDSPFLPPILPKKPKQQPKFVVQSREIATQITADALVPTQVVPDYWISKDTTINRQYDDLALRRANIQTGQSYQTGQTFQQQGRLEYDNRPMTYRSTFTDYEPPTTGQQGFEFEALSDEERGDVYSRLNDGKTYQKDAGTDLWMQKTDISFTVLLYLKKNLGINWKRAGQYLGVSRERLRRIEDVGIANARTGIEKMAQDMLFEWAEKDPQPTVAKLCAALEAADLSKLSQGVMEKVQKEKGAPTKRRKAKKGAAKRKIDDAIKVPISEETIPYRVMVYLKDNLGESWKDLAVCLKIPSPKIKAIEAEAWQVEKMAYDMLHEWRQRDKEYATVDRLIEALEKAQCKKLVKGVAARSQSYHFRIAA